MVRYEQHAALERYIIRIRSTDRYRVSLGKVALDGTPATVGDGRISFVVQQQHKRCTVQPPTRRAYLRQQSVGRVAGRGSRSIIAVLYTVLL